MAIVEVLRQLRTTFYRALSPFDRLLAGLRGTTRIPPLWLRRHVGAPDKFVSSARETASWIDHLNLLRRDAVVLDVGCGCGAMVPEIARRLGENGRYVGFDVHEPSILWCRKQFSEDERFAFQLAEVDSPYATSRSAFPVDRYRFPIPDSHADLVLAKSVFTHLLEHDTVHYLSEIRRVLAPGGTAFVSFFLFDEGLEGSPPAFPHPRAAAATVRWRLKHRRHSAVAYGKAFVSSLLESRGLALEEFIPGFWPGSDARVAGQDQLLLVAGESRSR